MSDEKVTVVDATGGRGGGGTAVAVIVGIVAILAILYVLFGTNLLSSGTQKIDADVKIDTPGEVIVLFPSRLREGNKSHVQSDLVAPSTL